MYDVPSTEPQYERINHLGALLVNVPLDKFDIRIVPTEIVHNHEDITESHDHYVSEGYEGAIVRAKYGKYHFGFRDKCLMKVKEFIDEEFIIIGCKITEGKSIGDSFVFELHNNIPNNTLTFFARPKGTAQQKEIWYNDIENIKGLKATVRYQERTPDGLPHQAHVVIIRDYE
jgi:ATP-dependent DNA ligase